MTESRGPLDGLEARELRPQAVSPRRRIDEVDARLVRHSRQARAHGRGNQGDEDAWKRVDVRDGSTGPLVVAGVTRRVVARPPRRQQGDEEL